MSSNIHPEFHRMLRREDKEVLLGQRGHVFWFFGLSGSGKSTLAHHLEEHLHAKGRMTARLDGDNLRTALNADLGFSDADREENIRRAAELARLFACNGIVTLASFICPTRALRKTAESIIGKQDFSSVYVRASFEECARRDVKGLYAKAAKGEVKQFTGKDSSFEEPHPDESSFLIDTEAHGLDACLTHLKDFALPLTALS